MTGGTMRWPSSVYSTSSPKISSGSSPNSYFRSWSLSSSPPPPRPPGAPAIGRPLVEEGSEVRAAAAPPRATGPLDVPGSEPVARPAAERSPPPAVLPVARGAAEELPGRAVLLLPPLRPRPGRDVSLPTLRRLPPPGGIAAAPPGRTVEVLGDAEPGVPVLPTGLPDRTGPVPL